MNKFEDHPIFATGRYCKFLLYLYAIFYLELP